MVPLPFAVGRGGGQPRPRQLTRTVAVRGARMDSSLMAAPEVVSEPLIRTIGNGVRSASRRCAREGVPLGFGGEVVGGRDTEGKSNAG